MKTMSHILREFQLLKQEYGSGAELAKLTGLSKATISRVTTGKVFPDESTIEKFCAAIEPGRAAQLAIAYASDLLPPSARSLIHMEPAVESKGRGRPRKGNAVLWDVYSRLSPTAQHTIDRLAKLFLEDDEFADLQRRMVEQFGKKERPL
jgi:transcriptional regulator with XRE-family HTH domain